MRAGSVEATQAPRQRSRIPIPALAKSGYGMANTALPISSSLRYSAQYKKADCDLAAVPSAVHSVGRCSISHFAHARPTKPSISILVYKTLKFLFGPHLLIHSQRCWLFIGKQDERARAQIARAE